MDSAVNELFLSSPSFHNSCINYNICYLPFSPCAVNDVHPEYRYSDTSAAWVLISAIIVFFMKAGFLLVELAFAQNVREKRYVVVLKHLDVFASAFGFFLIGFTISDYSSASVPEKFLQINDPVLWFFKFTFASNAATIVGGCLVTNQYKLRLLAAFLSSFIITGIIHSLIARWIWSNQNAGFLSVYRFCRKTDNDVCGEQLSFSKRMYVLDFAGGGAVHLVGGTAGLVLCLFAKLQNYLAAKKASKERSNPDSTTIQNNENSDTLLRDQKDTVAKRDFWEWMYPVDGGGENTNEAALGVLILWFSWFAFNCGSTENLETFHKSENNAIPSIIAVNMILAASAGGVAALLIASWAQIRSSSESVNANEIANGILSALVAITAGCPFYDYWAACIVGVIAVIVYHLGCWLEYKFHLEDTARVVPLHGLCGLWSVLAVGLFVFSEDAKCNLHITFEGLCYCYLRLPALNYGERLATQLMGALMMILVTGVIITVVYGILFLIPIKTRLATGGRLADKYNRLMSRVFKVVFSREDILFDGNLLFTGPNEIPHANYRLPPNISRLHGGGTLQRRLGRRAYADISLNSSQEQLSPQQDYGSLDPVNVRIRESLGSVVHHEEETDDLIITPSIENSMYDTKEDSNVLGAYSGASINNGSRILIN